MWSLMEPHADGDRAFAAVDGSPARCRAWRGYRTGEPWRNVLERFGKWILN